MLNKEDYLRIVESRYEAVKALNDGRSFYDYEKEFAAIMQDVSRELLEHSIGPVPRDTRKKKLSPDSGISK